MMPAGVYWIGDLCYVLHDEWSEFCNMEAWGGEYNLSDGRKFASYNTAWGDGTYYDNKKRAYGVDAGLIGCILLKDIDTTDKRNDVSLGHVERFDKPFVTGTTGRGVIFFGDVAVNTDA